MHRYCAFVDRFWGAVHKTDTCWLWTGGRAGGRYGKLKYRGRLVSAHRASWFLQHGVFPTLWVLHRCDTPLCVRPDHLFLGTAATNAQDSAQKGRRSRRGRRKLTETQVREIRQASGTATELANTYGVTASNIRYIRRGASWQSLFPLPRVEVVRETWGMLAERVGA